MSLKINLLGFFVHLLMVANPKSLSKAPSRGPFSIQEAAIPRDSSGVYSLPAGYLAVTGETIQASQHNPPLEDVAAALSGSVPRNGAAPMTAPLKMSDGSVSAPAAAFNTATGTGIYKTASGLGVAVAGTNVADITPSGLAVTGDISLTKSLKPKDAGDIASATALTLGDGNIFNVTGTTAITSIATKGVGSIAWLRFNGVLTLTHHSTDLILTGGLSITTAPGDWALFEEYATGDWRMITYTRANGTALQALLPPGHINGCTLSNGTDTTNDINIAAGSCCDSSGVFNISVAAMSGKQLDANWAPGAAAGMRYSAAVIANETYHIYAVAKPDGTQDIFAYEGVAGTDPDSSASISTVLAALQTQTGGADYAYARRIGSIVRTGNAIKAFTQDGDDIRWKSPPLDINTTSLSNAESGYYLTVPNGLQVKVRLNAVAFADGATLVYVRHPSDTDLAPAAGSAPLATIGRNSISGREYAQVEVMCNSSAQIYARANAANTTFYASTLSYLDTRGKN